MYVTTMLGSPLFQILFFTYLGRYAGSQDDAFFIVGNAIQVAAMAGIYGMTMGIANERQYGTLQPLLATPANRLAIFTGPRAAVHRQRARRLGVRLRGRRLFLDFHPRRGQHPAARGRRARDDVLVHRLRDADRLDRPPRPRRLLRSRTSSTS